MLTVSIKVPKRFAEQPIEIFDKLVNLAGEESRIAFESTVKDEMLARRHHATGHLQENIHGILENATTGKLVSVEVNDVAASALEYGTKPAGSGSGDGGSGAGDLQLGIEEWMAAKGIEGSAFLIARAIARKGLPLKGGLRRPFNAAQKKATRRVEKIWSSAFDRIAGELNRLE
jgi:hypothetical protein